MRHTFPVFAHCVPCEERAFLCLCTACRVRRGPDFPFCQRPRLGVFPACPAYGGPKVFACVVVTESQWVVPCIENARFGSAYGLILIENKNINRIRPFLRRKPELRSSSAVWGVKMLYRPYNNIQHPQSRSRCRMWPKDKYKKHIFDFVLRGYAEHYIWE